MRLNKENINKLDVIKWLLPFKRRQKLNYIPLNLFLNNDWTISISFCIVPFQNV